MLVLIGSRALARILNEEPRVNADFDLIGTYESIQKYIRMSPVQATYPLSADKIYIRRKDFNIEAEIAWPGSTGEEFIKLVQDDPMSILFLNDALIPSLNLLYALKMSHRFLKDSPHFLKTMADIHKFRRLGATLSGERLLKWVKAREKVTYSYGHPNLNQDKKGFFSDDNIDYIYDHDSLHEAMKIGSVPAYTKFQVEGQEVQSSKEKFMALDKIDQINAVLEETYVLALERSQIPHPDTGPLQSFKMALEKVCTSITSGWFRTFAWEHYHLVRSYYNPYYVNRFKHGLASGIIKSFKG